MDTTLASLHKLFERDLNKLEEEIRLYPNEDALWKLAKGIKNPGGNLCLHLCGNLQYYFGAVLLQSGYKRNRDLEFAARDVPVSELYKEIAGAKKAVLSTLANFKPEALDTPYPEEVFGHPVSNIFFMIHLAGHLNYHLGQVNYHRRLIAME